MKNTDAFMQTILRRLCSTTIISLNLPAWALSIPLGSKVIPTELCSISSSLSLRLISILCVSITCGNNF